MTRRRPNTSLSAAEIQSAIAEQEEQIALLRTDLDEALLAGESTAPYRRAIADIGATIVALQRDLGAAEAAEAAHRRARAADAAADVVRAAHSRFKNLFAALAAPALPPFVKDFF